MAEQKSQPGSSKSHPNDSESQIRESMQGKEPNMAPEAPQPEYTVEGNGPYKLVNKLDNSVVAESGDQEEMNKLKEELSKQPPEPPPQDTKGSQVGQKPQTPKATS